jgi:aspartate-semialdehyde dehydrogenase
MNESGMNYRVGLEGASTLLGKEILAVLKARNFPAGYVIGLEDRGEAPETPILNISDDPIPVIQESSGERPECDFIFRTRRQALATEEAEAQEGRGPGAGRSGRKRSFVIDASAGVLPSNSVLCMPLFDNVSEKLAAASQKGAQYFVCPHAASIALAGLVLRLAANLDIRYFSALILLPASELGPDAIDELQKQTIGLLNFADVPRKVFGAQAAFNVSPRLGGKAKDSLADAEIRIRSELESILAGRAAPPAVRVVQAPTFYSMAFSIYAQSPQRATAIQVEQALSGEGIRWVRSSQPSASPVEAQGSATLLLDPVSVQPGPPGGFWLWGRVDDLRLQAENAVAIAEHLRPFLGEA